MTELWAKNHMTIFGHTHQIWSILAHKLVKYQYFEWNQLYMEGKPILHIFYDYQLNIYLTVDSVFK